jgi:hypothetical protein
VHPLRSFLVHLAGGADRLASAVFARVWPSYVLIVLLQAKVIWRIWDLRDLTAGDTAAYFHWAKAWADGFQVNIVWSPLYTSFFGSFLWLTDDPTLATTLHRVVIVMLAVVGVLFVLRALLPPPLALLGAVWWALLPINFNTLYEVHLFALLPILAAWGLILGWDRPWARGAAVGILVAAAALVRNELSVAAAALLVLCLIYEWRLGDAAPSRRMRSRTSIVLLAYGLPLVAAAAACGLAYWRSSIRFPQIWGALHAKHAANMCQVYAFGYQQRDPTWTANPWLDCGPLATRVFGHAWPTAGQMLAGNPSAAIEHYLWNLGLVSSGLQVLLFNAMSGRVNPDYAPVQTAWYPMVLGALMLAVIAAGAWAVRREWKDGARSRIVAHARVALAFVPVLIVAVPVALTQRPRPSYFFHVSVIAIALTLAAVFVLIRRSSRLCRTAAIASVATAAALVIAQPSYFVRYRSARPLAAKLRHVAPHRSAIDAAPGRVLIGEFSSEVTSYLGIRRKVQQLSKPQADILSNEPLLRWDRSVPLEHFLEEEGIEVVYLDPSMLASLRSERQAARLLGEPRAIGWQVLGFEEGGSTSWRMLARDRR